MNGMHGMEMQRLNPCAAYGTERYGDTPFRRACVLRYSGMALLSGADFSRHGMERFEKRVFRHSCSQKARPRLLLRFVSRAMDSESLIFEFC